MFESFRNGAEQTSPVTEGFTKWLKRFTLLINENMGDSNILGYNVDKKPERLPNATQKNSGDESVVPLNATQKSSDDKSTVVVSPDSTYQRYPEVVRQLSKVLREFGVIKTIHCAVDESNPPLPPHEKLCELLQRNLKLRELYYARIRFYNTQLGQTNDNILMSAEYDMRDEVIDRNQKLEDRRELERIMYTYSPDLDKINNKYLNYIIDKYYPSEQ
jgi:hypothetical protein